MIRLLSETGWPGGPDSRRLGPILSYLPSAFVLISFIGPFVVIGVHLQFVRQVTPESAGSTIGQPAGFCLGWNPPPHGTTSERKSGRSPDGALTALGSFRALEKILASSEKLLGGNQTRADCGTTK